MKACVESEPERGRKKVLKIGSEKVTSARIIGTLSEERYRSGWIQIGTEVGVEALEVSETIREMTEKILKTRIAKVKSERWSRIRFASLTSPFVAIT